MINNPVLPEQLSQAGTLGVLIGNLVAAGIIIAGIMTFLYLVLGGIEWILSAGDKGGLQQARDRITNALIGLTIVVAAWAIITMASNFLGFPFPDIPIPSLGGQQGAAGGGTKTTTVEPLTPTVAGSGETGADCTSKGDDWCTSRICHYNRCAGSCTDFNQDPAACSSHYACYYKSACYWNQGEVCCLYR